MAVDAFFLPVGQPVVGQRFCIVHAPRSGVAKGALLYVHPFAEEMNKSRRMAALQARLFADNGYTVLQLDLLGCGDSSGDFGDATWSDWVEDVLSGCRWLRSRAEGPLWLWGLRAGCLLAGEAARQMNEPSRLLFWQPALSGKQVLQQFMRLHTAGEMMSGASTGGAMAPRARWAEGRAAEIAGYRLSASLARELESVELSPCPAARHLHWLELSTRDGALPGPASSRVVEAWQAAGCRVEAGVVSGPAFWQTAEIEEAPALLQASLEAVRKERASS